MSTKMIFDKIGQRWQTDGLPFWFNLIFQSPQFPFWYILQIYWGTYIIQRSDVLNKTNVFRKLIVTFLVVYLPSELCAFLLNLSPQIPKAPLTLLIFLTYFLAFQYSPKRILLKINKYLMIIVAPLHTFEVLRCLHHYVSETTEYPWYVVYLFGCLLVLSEIIPDLIDRIFRSKRTVTRFTSGVAIFRMIFLYSTYFFLTVESPFMRLFGLLPEREVLIFVGVLVAAMEAAVSCDDAFGEDPLKPKDAMKEKED